MNLECKNRQRGGSALLTALGITLVLSIALASYLSLTLNERSLATRSADWNAAIPVAESGVEEALTELYYYGTNNLATNSYWTLGTDGMYHKSRTLASGTYYTAIQMGTYPTIWSTGRVVAPFGSTNAGSTNLFVKRLVKVTTYKTSSLGGGITAKGTIALSGSAVMDSYSSLNGVYSSSIATSNAVALTNTNLSGAISLSGGSSIHGNAVTGPGGTVSGSSGVTGTVSANANVQINDVTFPTFFTNSGTPYSIAVPPSGLFGSTNYDTIFTNGNYKLSTLCFGGGSPNLGTTMAVSGQVVIYLTQTGNNVFVVGGSGFVYIAPGGSLTIYTAGDVTISGGGLVNNTLRPINMTIYGLPTCANITDSGSGAYIGVIDAPEALVTDSGSGSLSGSFVAGSFNDSGGSAIHYDTSLGGTQGFAVQTWNELPAP